MATDSAAKCDNQVVHWQVGDRCLAPHPTDGRLCQGTIQRLTVTGRGEAAALVKFTCHQNQDEDEEEEEGDEGMVVLAKLQKAALSLYEKPLFHNSQVPPGASVPFALSCTGESIPYTINRYLRDYQREGAKFIYNSYARGRGCILGDDMGLGKTIQVIAFLAATLGKTGTWQDVENNMPHFLLSQKSSEKRQTHKVFLIVAPLSVLYNWKDELDTWGHFQSIIVHGTRKDEEFARVRRGRCEIALTTYETLRLCLDQFNSIGWSAIIVDEAHRIKNPKSQITHAMKAMRCKVRVGLTGTVLQNNLEELWCVMDWAIPGCLGNLGHFKARFSEPIELGHKHTSTKRALATGRRAVEVLAKRISRWFLRRTKALISAQLPKKDDRVVYCSMTEFQEAVYRTVLDSEDVTLLLRSGHKCSCKSGKPRKKCCFKTNSKGIPVRFLYFSYLTILRKASNHVALLQPKGSTSKKQELFLNEICEKVFRKFPEFTQRCREAAFEAMSDPMYSGKMKVLQRLLRHFLQNKDKVLLFSLSTKLLDILESHCVAEGLDFRRLDGNTKSQERMKIVREFNSSPDINICLLSTMAGGLGLNFVGANVVVLFDPTWNPANDLQAIDRAYRIGQWRDVSVFRLITLGSVEEVIYLRQVYKQQLQSSVVGNQHARRYFEAVQGSDSHKGELFGIRNLFRLQTHGTCLTRQILEREGRVEAGVLTARTRTGTQETAPEEQTGSAGNCIAVSGDGGGAESGAGPASGSGEESGVSGGVLDFSGDEEEYGGEEKWGGRRKRPGGPTPNSSPAGLSLFQHGFAKLLQGGGGDTGGASDSEDDGRGGESDGDPPMDPETTAPPLQRHGWTVSSESDEGGKGAGGISAVTKNTPPSHAHCLSSGKGVGSRDITGQGKPKAWRRKADNRGNVACEADYDTDESGDIQLQPTCTNRRPCVRFGGVPDIRSFTSSSEDEPSPKKRKAVAMTERTDGGDGAFTALKSWTLAPPPSPSSNQRARPRQGVTIDKLLDGVTEVAYMHSNQSVVGSSKAEDRISRAALRDVFERRKYSQVPANELLDSSEVLSGQSPELTPPPEQVSSEGGCGGQRVEHPVTHTVRATHRTRNAIVIMGGTPSAICRTQLEEMAAFFKVESVRDFARDLLRSNSASRQTRLREFYHHQNPNLGPALDQMLPEPAPKPASRASRPSCSSSSAVYPQRRKPGSKSSRPLTGSDRKGEVMDPSPAEPPAGKGKVVWKEDSSFQRFRPPSKSKLDAEPMDRTASPTELPAVKHGVLGGHGSGFKGSQPATKSRLYTELQDPDLTEWPVRNVSVAVEGGLNSKTRGPPHPKNTTLPSERAGGITRSPFDDSPGPSAQLDRRSRAGSPSDCPSDGRRRSHLGLGETEWEKGVALKPKPRNEHEGSAPKSQKHLLMDLIGDTSVLDDLFRPRTRGGASKDTPLAQAQAPLPAQAPPTAPPQAGEETAKKNRRKDIWDILNEGDEESLNRLTDLSLAEQLFRRAEVSREAKKDAPVDESSRLWKKNDKFLWKR